MLDLFRSLPGAIAALEGSPEVREAMVFACWRRVAGRQTDEQTRPLCLDGSKLTIAVENRTWQRQLMDLSPQMIFKINSLLGKPMVRFIEFQIENNVVSRTPGDPGAIMQESWAISALPVEVLIAAESIADAELKRRFLLAAGSCVLHRRCTPKEEV